MNKLTILKKYSRHFSNYLTSENKGGFEDVRQYENDGYSGELIKDGEPKVIGGEYIPEETKVVEDTRFSSGSNNNPESIMYKEDGFDGELHLQKTPQLIRF